MENKIVMLSTNCLEHHPDNPRKAIGDVSELCESIKAKGILQNLTVVPKPNDSFKYYVVIGNRRLEASIAAGLEDIPCVISDMDYKTQIETMMVENIQREDLTVVEQAEGMQMMLDLGSSIDEISDKTGFSQSTIRRRLKLNEYDKKKVVSAQERGATLDDFVKLEQIKSKAERNRLLKALGTSDFNLEYKRKLNEQTNKEYEKLALKELKTFAEPFPNNAYYWDWKFKYMNKYSYKLRDFVKGKRVPKNKNRKYYYYLIKSGDWEVRIYIDNPNYEVTSSNKPKKSEEEKNGDRVVRALNKMGREHYELRKEFVMSLIKRSNIKNCDSICLKTLIEIFSEYGHITSSYNNQSTELFDMGNFYKKSKFIELYEQYSDGVTVAATYRSLEDSKEKTCYTRWTGEMPKYNKNENLERIYNFLTQLGYKMSTEECQILDGTHELYGKEEN